MPTVFVFGGGRVTLNFLFSKPCMACAVIGTHLSTGRILLMLGKVQFELQKLVDCYVSAYCYYVICSTCFDMFYSVFNLILTFCLLYRSALIYS